MTPQERHYTRLGRNDRYAETDEDNALLAAWRDFTARLGLMERIEG